DSLSDRAKDDRVVMVAPDDPDMTAAFRSARERLSDFLQLARAPRKGMTNFALKVEIKDGGRSEYFWVTPFAESEKGFTGTINNTPEIVHTVTLGQRITFSRDDIYDWMYRDHGWMKGNFTACAMLKHERPAEAEAFRKEYRLSCN